MPTKTLKIKHEVWIHWGSKDTRADNPEGICYYKFKTAAELDAFMKGADEASGWMDFHQWYQFDLSCFTEGPCVRKAYPCGHCEEAHCKKHPCDKEQS